MEPSIIKEGVGNKKKKKEVGNKEEFQKRERTVQSKKENRTRKGQSHTAVNRASERLTNSLKATI